jgi:hypothetical protein
MMRHRASTVTIALVVILGHHDGWIGPTGGWRVEASATEPLLPAWNHSAPGLTYWTHY